MKSFVYVITLSLVLSGNAETNTKNTNGKKLSSPQLVLLNKQFDQNPKAIARTKITCARCIKTIQAIDNMNKQPASEKNKEQEQKLIAKYLKDIVEPVKAFFADVIEYNNIVMPVIKESLGQDAAQSFLIKFLKTGDKTQDVSAFFEQEIKTFESLKIACLELITVFNDLNENLPPETQKKCDDFIREMLEAKKAPTQNPNPAK